MNTAKLPIGDAPSVAPDYSESGAGSRSDRRISTSDASGLLPRGTWFVDGLPSHDLLRFDRLESDAVIARIWFAMVVLVHLDRDGNHVGECTTLKRIVCVRAVNFRATEALGIFFMAARLPIHRRGQRSRNHHRLSPRDQHGPQPRIPWGSTWPDRSPSGRCAICFMLRLSARQRRLRCFGEDELAR
jgi:hypothetical protein